MRLIRSVATLATSSLMIVAAMLAAPTTASANDGDAVTSSEVAAALGNTDDTLVSEPAPSTTDTDSAALVTQNGTTTDVPKNPEDGVTFESEGASSITIDLPNADESKNAKRLSDGTVVYPGSDGSANAVIPTEHGVQMLTTIENADAPTRFAYKVDVPDGGKVEVIEDGNAVVLDNNGTPMMAVAAPWARDANGVTVPTKFETDGTSLTQVVEHTSNAYAYPVVADPFWIPAWAVVQIIRCGFGGALGWIASAGWKWYWRAAALIGGCLTGMR